MRQSSISAMSNSLIGNSNVARSSPSEISRSGRPSRRQAVGASRSSYGYISPPLGRELARRRHKGPQDEQSYRRETSSEEISTVASVDTVYYPVRTLTGLQTDSMHTPSESPLPSPTQYHSEESSRRRRRGLPALDSPSSTYSAEGENME